MRKVFLLVFPLLIHISFYSCDVDPYEGDRPTDYPNTTWVCDEYDITFSVNSEGYLENNKILLNGEYFEFGFTWSSLDSLVIINKIQDESTEELFNGYCEFGKKSFTITVDNTNSYFDEAVILKFVRK